MSNADRAGCGRTQEDEGQGERGVSRKKWTPSCPRQKTAHQGDKKGGGNHLMLWEADQSRKDNVSIRKG